ncbi:MAG: hypothetical protein IR164_03845 [Devosia sp.]|uniref:hypothetical protein n=1 Tax=Devosia sp. TaxID=1871048 RepID=UPI001A0C57AF|nr:hypothetical protein [Devosia sp.]MBF0678057.1 hypothetical protein [Devosia sp.]
MKSYFLAALAAFLLCAPATAQQDGEYKYIKDHYDQQHMMTFCNIEGFIDDAWLAEVQMATTNAQDVTDPVIAARAWDDSQNFFRSQITEIKSWSRSRMEGICENVRQIGIDDLGIGTYEGDEECDGC